MAFVACILSLLHGRRQSYCFGDGDYFPLEGFPAAQKALDLVGFYCKNSYVINKRRRIAVPTQLASFKTIHSMSRHLMSLGAVLGLIGILGCKGTITGFQNNCTTKEDCGADQICLNEQCVGESCPQTCLPGEAACRDGKLTLCVVGRDRCPNWNEPNDCDPTRRCVEGECIDVTNCTDTCAADEQQCAPDGSGIMRCRTDDYGCLTFVLDQPCGMHMECIANECICAHSCTVGQTDCGPDGGERTCAGPDEGGCTYWSEEVACGAHQQCDLGQCTCSESCTAATTECGPNGGVRTCEGPDGDGCTYWSEDETCYADMVCVESFGECMPDTPEHCYTVNECLYEGQKLCQTSSDYRVCEKDDYTNCLHWSPS